MSILPTSQTQIITARPEARGAARTGLLVWGAAALLLLFGLALRLYDLTDPPLDFHYTRQLRGAIIARGLYYTLLPGADPQVREDAIAWSQATGQYEPPLLESLTALTYLLTGGENFWVGRIYSSLFWVIGGAALFALARRLALSQSPGPGASLAALLALAYYLALPFGVQASRSFQPDPGMTMWIILSIYALYRWMEIAAAGEGSWKWALLAGLLGGMAILTKTVAFYILAGGILAAVLSTLGFRGALRSPQSWSMALLMFLPSLAFLLLGRGGSAVDYFQNWTVSLSHLLLEPGLYVRWLNLVQDLMGLTVLLLALIGVLIARPRARALLFGLFLGYFVYGLTLPYQMYTHNYYHLQLIPLLGLALVPAVVPLLDKVWEQGRAVRLAGLLVLLAGLGFASFTAFSALRAEDFRAQPAYWQEIGAQLPRDGKTVALTPDYGYRLLYYGWRKVTLWPNRGEINLSQLRGREKEFEDFFNKRIAGKSYFLISSLKQFNEQADLKAALTTGYPVYAEGDGYIIFDLGHPLH
jgi:hypothetical protein